MERVVPWAVPWAVLCRLIEPFIRKRAKAARQSGLG